MNDYFKRNTETNKWDEYKGKENIVDTYTLRTYIPNGMIIYSEKSRNYIELSDGLAKIADSGNIESLDKPKKRVKGYWSEYRNKNYLNFKINKLIKLIFF